MNCLVNLGCIKLSMIVLEEMLGSKQLSLLLDIFLARCDGFIEVVVHGHKLISWKL